MVMLAVEGRGSDVMGRKNREKTNIGTSGRKNDE